MRSFAVLAVIVGLCGPAQAQSPTSQNSVYVELLGNGLFYSANYDRMITESIGARVGIGYIQPANAAVLTFPVMVHYLVGSGNNKLELGFGACVISQPENVSFSFKSSDKEFSGSGALGTMTVGYRYQRADQGFVFRAGFTPFFGVIGFQVSVGASVGYGF
jgi:hypothetical protein